MRKIGMGMTTIAGAAAVALIGAGVANAAADPTPPGSYQLCGTAYTGALLVDNYHGGSPGAGTPTGAVPQSGKVIKGELIDPAAPGTPVATYSATTNTNGQFCIQGNADMANKVMFNSHYVKLSDNGGASITQAHPGGIDLAAFADHRVGGLFGLSATGFNLVY